MTPRRAWGAPTHQASVAEPDRGEGEGGTRAERSPCWVFLPRADGGHGRAGRRRGTGHFITPTFRASHRREFGGASSEAHLPGCIPRHVSLLLLSSHWQRTGRSFQPFIPINRLPEAYIKAPMGIHRTLRSASGEGVLPQRRRDGSWPRNDPERMKELWRGRKQAGI